MSIFIGYGDARTGSINGVSGVINTYAACTGASGAKTVNTALSVSAGDYVFLWQTQGTGATNCEMVKVEAPSTGAFNTTTNLINTYVSGAQAIKVPQYSLGTPGVITALDWNGSTGGLAIAVATGAVTLPALSFNGANGSSSTTGVSGASGGGFRGGDSTNSGVGQAYAGEGTSGGIALQSAANGNGGGGGNQSANSGAGGGGGNGVGGSSGSSAAGSGGSGTGGGGTGGTAAGSADLSTIALAGGGGGANRVSAGVRGSGASGAAGFILIAPSISVTSTISATGGIGGNTGDANTTGGSGAGGSILFMGKNISLGSSLVTALGGSTGLGGSGDAAVGRIAVYAPTAAVVSGTTSPAYTFTALNSLALQAQGFII